MANERFESIWDAIEDDHVERERLKMLSGLMMMLAQHIKERGWTQKEAARHLGVTQPRISDLVRGKIDAFSIDFLVTMLTAAGVRLKIEAL